MKKNPILMADHQEYKSKFQTTKWRMALAAPVEGARYAYHKGKEIWYGYDAAFQEQDLHKKNLLKD